MDDQTRRESLRLVRFVLVRPSLAFSRPIRSSGIFHLWGVVVNKNRVLWSFGRRVALGLTLALLTSPAVGASYWWDTTTTGTWGTTADWWTAAGGTTIGGPPAATDDAVFNGTGVNGAATVQLGAATSVAGMTFANTGSTLLDSNSSTPYALTTGTDGITVNSGAGAVTLGDPINLMPITLGGNQTWTNNSSYPMSVVDNVNNGSCQLTLSGSGNTVFSGGIGNGSGGVTKSGGGVATLLASGSTTALDTLLQFTGGVNVTGGTLQIVNANALFNNTSGTAAMTISTSAGAVLELDSTSGYFPKSGYYGYAYSNWALGTVAGLTINGNGILRFNGTGSGTFGLNDQSPFGAVTIAMTGGTFDIEGGTLINGGFQDTNWTNNKASMNIASGATFLMWDGNSPTIDALTGAGTIGTGAWANYQTLTVGSNNGSGTFSGVFTNPNYAIYGLTKTGSGIQALSGCNTYSGTTTVNQGALKLDFSAPGAPGSNIINNATNLSGLALGGGTLAIQGNLGATNSQQFNGLTVNVGASALTATSGNGGTLNVSLGTVSYNMCGTVDFTLPARGTISATQNSYAWPCGLVGGVNSSIAFATVNGGSTWATLASTGGSIGALTSYSTTNSFANNQVGTTLITSSTSNNGGGCNLHFSLGCAV